MRTSLAMALSTLLLTGCSVFGVRSAYEQAVFVVVERLSDTVEVRRYAPQLVAETTVSASDRDSGRNAAFRLLFDYISGANRAQTKVAMTTPVETAESSQVLAMTTPVEAAPAASGGTTMRFFLPAEFTAETAPQPTDPRVRVMVVPERTLAVVRFSGSTGADNVNRHTRALMASLDGTSWRAVGEPTAMFYDPPWTLPFLRRNEVAIPVAGG